jgi:hypothetical protein
VTDPALNVAQVLWAERLALSRSRPSPTSTSPVKMQASDTDKNIADSGRDTAAENTASEEAVDTCTDINGPDNIITVYRCMNKDNLWALCLSGGGIRSAAFALGVIQRLAQQPIAPKERTDASGSVLQQFEYLSTVSGGGYIGSWLSAWLFQEREKRRGSGGADDVMTALHDRIDGAETIPIANLRRNSHYFAPRFSAISPDLWSNIAAFIRNLCLNWILLVPPIILAVLIPKAYSYLFIDASSIKIETLGLEAITITVTATIGFVVALSFSVANRPSIQWINASQKQFLRFDTAVFVVSAALLVFVLGSLPGQNIDSGIIPWFGVAIYFVSWIAALAWPKVLSQNPQFQREPRDPPRWMTLSVDFVAWLVAGGVFGVLIATGFNLVARDAVTAQTPLLACIFGVPWIVAARIIADVIFVSVSKFIRQIDETLEYQARLGGILTLFLLGWLIWFGLVLWTPIYLHTAPWLLPAALTAAGGLSGAFALITGAGSKTTAIIEGVSGLRRYLGLNRLAAIAAAIFSAIVVMGLSIILNSAFRYDQFQNLEAHPPWPFVVTVALALYLLILLASLVIGVNQYSLHSIYRDRLVRAFLGASRNEQKRDESKNRFTDFDGGDSPWLYQLWNEGVNPRGDDWRPLHIINAAVNLVSSKNLAWQERMAAPFTFSPLHCGSGSSIFSNGANGVYGAYRPTNKQPDYDQYSLNKADVRFQGPTLGTAMAISGAAVSPNMGYNTSPGLSILMALFNVRLGWWTANPNTKNEYYWRASPSFALTPYVMEAFGLTNENASWVYLSDGGHFDNLALYEMIRRRCRLIVVADAGDDPEYTFIDLGNTLRKIWIDLGVFIDIRGLDCLKKRFKERPTPAKREPYWAVGRIKYNSVDGEGEDGWLLYLKAGLHGTEPMDVLSYAMAHRAFPHETTANQFFTESQFESYRMLGYEIVRWALECGGCPPPSPEMPAASTAGDRTPPEYLTLDKVVGNLHRRMVEETGELRCDGRP